MVELEAVSIVTTGNKSNGKLEVSEKLKNKMNKNVDGGGNSILLDLERGLITRSVHPNVKGILEYQSRSVDTARILLCIEIRLYLHTRLLSSAVGI
jgi:hypothetical protein